MINLKEYIINNRVRYNRIRYHQVSQYFKPMYANASSALLFLQPRECNLLIFLSTVVKFTKNQSKCADIHQLVQKDAFLFHQLCNIQPC
jgi:hypothetical protein